MTTRFYNTLTRKKEEFIPIEQGIAKMYTCGPTVYNYAHIGNYRAYIFEDILRRYLKYKGYQVTQVMNITDVDDKTIRDSAKEGKTLADYTKIYTDAFFEDLATLNVEKAEVYPRATEHIPEMVQIIKKLEEKGFTYERDGSIYYKIALFPTYGQLSKMDLSGVKAGGSLRIDLDEYDKEDARDFALWKKTDTGEEVGWETELGRGRPGWHIECSAMSMKYLGETFDLHTGGVDNIFPHHENEIAQSEAATGKRFVNYWLHCDHLIVDGEKMSKSRGNFFTLRDLLAKNYSPKAIRYLLLSGHYRGKINFTEDGIKQADAAINRLQDCVNRLLEIKEGQETTEEKIPVKEYLDRFEQHLDDDLNISAALGEVFELTRLVNIDLSAEKVSFQTAQEYLNAFKEFDKILGVLAFQVEMPDAQIQEKINQRQQARKNKDYKLADLIRNELAEKGIILEDTKEGVRYKRVN